MKRIYLLLVVLLSAACQRLTDEELSVMTETKEVRIVTRSASEISYPITLFAFNEKDGKLVSSVSVHSAEEPLAVELAAGNYRLVALGGSEDCVIPDSPTLTSVLTLPDDNWISQPLQLGSADIQVTKDASANLTLYNQVSAVNLSLTDIPSEVTDVNVTLSNLYSSLALDNTLDGSASVRIGLNKQTNGNWNAPVFYTLPGSTSKLVLSITTQTPSGEQTYGYTHSSSLEGNTPYSLLGSFTEGFAINGHITLAGWKTAQEIAFSFGTENNENSTEGEGNDDENGEITVANIPDVGGFWNNHFVAGIEYITSNSADLILLSLKEWTEVTSAFHQETPDKALELVDEYVEEGMGNWSVPTREDAKIMRSYIGMSDLTDTNLVLSANSIAGLSNGNDIEGNKVRYLCDDATYSFTWVDTSVSKVGEKRTYHLRAVKRVRVIEE